jgi:transcriptional regulator with XRE-family HTH domain
LAERITDPIEVPPGLWQRPDTVDALRGRNIQKLFYLLRKYAAASQTRLAIACGLTQGKVSEIMAGTRRVVALDVFERIADGLDMPSDARLALGLAPLMSGSGSMPGIPSRDGSRPPPALILGPPDNDEAEDPMRRRTFTRLAGASLLGSVLADAPAARGAITSAEAFAAALAMHPVVGSGSGPVDVAVLERAVAGAKRSYQACRYSEVMSQLPRLLADLHAACASLDGDPLLKADALSADAYHVAASILLKLDDHGLAWLAADRSMRAADLSEDPLVIGSSARIITHALMADGHYGAATSTASSYAERLGSAVKDPTPDSLSVYGSLLLRGALAAGMAENRGDVATLLDEAGEAGSQLGADYNHRWTAFGPANVLLHRISIAVSLGDAGVAIDQARKVDLDQLPITERKASFLIDTARAFAQWGKHENAYHALRAAEQLAEQEVSGRPAVRRLVGELLATAPSTIRPHIRDFADRIGAIA